MKPVLFIYVCILAYFRTKTLILTTKILFKLWSTDVDYNFEIVFVLQNFFRLFIYLASITVMIIYA